MKNVVLAFTILVSSFAHGMDNIDSFIRAFPYSNLLHRSVDAGAICDSLFSQWPAPIYKDTIIRLGDLWKSQPEAAYFVLDTCQTKWINQYLDLSKSVEIKDGQTHSRLAYLFATEDIMHIPQYLGQEIAILAKLPKSQDDKTPPSPYSLLTGLSIGEKELDLSIQTALRQGISALAGLGSTIAVLKVVKDGALLVQRGGMVAEEVPYAAAAAIIIGGLVDFGVDAAIWQLQNSDMVGRLDSVIKKFDDKSVPRPLLLNQFYSAVGQLGLFYNMSVYDQESDPQNNIAKVNDQCFPELVEYFKNPNVSTDSFATRFATYSLCNDSVTLWLGASAYLNKKFPNVPQAKEVSDRLLRRAKLTFESYLQTKAYLETLPVCESEWVSPFFSIMYCHDPKTGAMEAYLDNTSSQSSSLMSSPISG